MGFREVCSKINKIFTKISIIGGALGIIILGYSFLSDDSSVNQSLYIDTVKGIEIQGQSMEDLVEEIMYFENGRDPSADWVVEGETDQGKVVSASARSTKVLFYTEKNGDYIQLRPQNVVIDYGDRQETLAQKLIGVPSGKRGITTLRIFLTIYDPFIFNA